MGDVVHNARSALDHLAYRLSQRPGTGTHFPIHKSPTAKNGKRIIPTISGGVSAQVEYVLGAVQPYNGGENYLHGLLHDLDIMDKHKLLLTTVAAFEGPPMTSKKSGVEAQSLHTTGVLWKMATNLPRSDLPHRSSTSGLDSYHRRA